MDKYKSYKNSNIEWLGSVPEHWKLDRIKNIGTLKARVGWKALKASEYVKSGYFFLSTPNIKYVDIDYKNVNYITKERYYESPEIMLENGDILLVKDGSTLGIVNIIKNLKAKGTVNSSIGVLRLKKQESRYFFYFLKSNYLQNIIGLKKEGMGVPHLFQKDINNFSLSIPPLKEQTQIADYLDAKITAIDKKINLLEQKIINYKAYRKTVINETVTKGLNKSIKFKNSGIDWIGEIPENWEVKRLKDLSIISTGDKNSEDFDFEGIYPFFVRSPDIKKINSFSFEGEAVLTAGDGDVGKVFHYINGKFDVHQRVYCIRKFKKQLNAKYLYYYMYSKFYNQAMINNSNSIVNSIRLPLLRNLKVPISKDSKEQQQVTDYLDTKTTTIDKIVKNLEIQITTLKELRKTLINEVVTGKVKVSV